MTKPNYHWWRGNTGLFKRTESGTAPTVALANEVAEIDDDADVSSPTFMADIVVTDDETGTNELSLSAGDTSLFFISGTELYLEADVDLSAQSGSMTVTVQVDDGVNTPDTAVFSITVNEVGSGTSPVWDLLSANISPQSDDTELTSWDDSQGNFTQFTWVINSSVSVQDDTPPAGSSYYVNFDGTAGVYMYDTLSTADAQAMSDDSAGGLLIIFRPASVSGENRIVSFTSTDDGDGSIAVATFSDEISVYLKRSGSDYVFVDSNNANLSTGTWYKAFIDQPGSGGGLNIWLNGSELTLDSPVVTGAGDANDWFADIVAAGSKSDDYFDRISLAAYGLGSSLFDGDIESCQYFNQSLSDAEKASLTS